MKKWLAIAALFFAGLNLTAGFIFAFWTYPGTKIAETDIGWVKRSELDSRLSQLNIIPGQINLENNNLSYQLETSGLVSLDRSQTSQSEKKHRSWLPVYNLLRSPKLDLEVNLDQAKLDSQRRILSAKFYQPPLDARIDKNQSEFFIQKDIIGQQIIWDQLNDTIKNQLRLNKFSFSPPLSTIEPGISENTLRPEVEKLNKQLAADLNLTYQEVSIHFDRQEIIKWYQRSENTWELADYVIGNSVEIFAASQSVSAKNVSTAVSKIKQSLAEPGKLDFKIVEAPLRQKALTYCVRQKDIKDSVSAELSEKVAAVFSDPRGWSLGGHLVFKPLSSGCDFTVWLAAAAAVPGFGAICDQMWSCMVSPNVIINHDRWRNASKPWATDRQSIEDYRTMVINHETGHYLGHGHSTCPGKGRLAPVMQQQSIKLGGCVFNPWPLESELQLIKDNMGL